MNTAFFRYNLAFWVFLLLMFAGQILAGLGPVFSYYLYAPLTFLWVVVVTFVVFRKPPTPEPTTHPETNSEAPTARKPRIDWIDQLKVLLICLVVVGHSS